MQTKIKSTLIKGMLSRDDMVNAIINGNLKIYPFNQDNLTGLGYNISTTNFALSTSEKRFLTIYNESDLRQYVYIPANDTILFYSKEYVEVDSSLAGIFHSKVSRVSRGFGHINTTLDPTWKGQLLFSLNNPTSRPIKFELDGKKGNLATLTLHGLVTPVTESGEAIHDNNRGRCELVLEHFAEPLKSRKYKEKFHQQREFFAKTFADSLNGYDSFVDKKTNAEISDEYTIKVDQLFNLEERLKKDREAFYAGRRKLEGDYKYELLDTGAKKLVNQCILRNIDEGRYMAAINYEHNAHSSVLDIVEAIDKILSIISFEVENIDHIRRIRWQNTEIYKIAGEESEAAKLKKIAVGKKLGLRIFIAVAIALMPASIMFLLSYFSVSVKTWIESNLSIIASFYSTWIAIWAIILKPWEMKK